MSALDAALSYAARFGPIWPQTPQKTGYRGSNGSHDATRDEDAIRRWWSLHPEALPALMTGEVSGIVGLDIDRKNSRNGFDSLELLGVPFHPMTPTTITPSGGAHLLFRWPGAPVRSSQDRLGAGLEVKGDGAWITLPPGPGRFWDQHLGPDTPIAPMPAWMATVEPKRPPSVEPVKPTAGLSPYADAAVDSACRRILAAPAGKQEATLNAQSFAIGTLAGAGAIPADFARRALIWAASQIRSFDPARPWQPCELEQKVARSFDDGMRHPREARRA
jgi:hypothetical protein